MKKGINDSIEVFVFRKKDSNYEFLLLKRIQDRGGFWQPVTGRIEEGETKEGAVKREINEEAGITNILRIVKKIHTFLIEKTGKNEFVFGVEVDGNERINLKDNIYPEHNEFRWYGFNQALSLLKWPGNKEGLRKLNDKLK